MKLGSTELHGLDYKNDFKEFVDESIILAIHSRSSILSCERSDMMMGETPKSRAKGLCMLTHWQLIPMPLTS